MRLNSINTNSDIKQNRGGDYAINPEARPIPSTDARQNASQFNQHQKQNRGGDYAINPEAHHDAFDSRLASGMQRASHCPSRYSKDYTEK